MVYHEWTKQGCFIGITLVVTVLVVTWSYSETGALVEISKSLFEKSHSRAASHAAIRSSFRYSTGGIFKTILGIKERNCRVSKGPGYEKPGKCDKIKACNDVISPKTRLPPTCKQRLPGCIIIGVYKAGTREFIDFLAMHPGIVILKYPLYEVSFFSTMQWYQGLDYYRKRMPYSMRGQLTIEKSPNYYTVRSVPAKIHKMNPNIKLILLVRNPVDRAISHVTFSFKNDSLDFIHNLKTIGDVESSDSVLKYSFYDAPFERYLRYFNRSQIQIIDSEDFKHDPFKILHETENFLGLPHLIQKTDFIFNDEKGFYCLNDVDKNELSTCYGETRGRTKEQKDLSFIKPLLRKTFESHNKRFFNMTGRTFPWT